MTSGSDGRVLNSGQIAAYRRDGFVHVPQLVPAESIDRVKAILYRLYRNVAGPDEELDAKPEPWNEPIFDARLCALREADREAFGLVYDSAQNAVVTLQLLLNEATVGAGADVLGDSPENLSCSGLLLRTDTPQDTRSVLDWHQDRAYFPQNFNGESGVVLAVLMNETDRHCGALRLCPGSHREPYHPPALEQKADHFSTEQRRIGEDKVSRYAQIDAEGKKGDAYLFHMNMFHSSGANVSDRIRYSAIMRFHRMLADDYVPFRSIEKYNENRLRAVERDFSRART